jgi:ribosomal protein S18 acetylase RimI-like enzyme
MLGPVQVESLGFRTDLMLRRLEGSTIVDHGAYLVVTSPAQPDFWWGNFVLMPRSALRDDPAIWVSRFAAAFPGARHVALGVDGTQDSAEVPASFLAAGLKPERDTVLTATSVREPPRPNHAAQYRRLDGDDDWRQAEQLRAACSDISESAGGREFDAARVRATRELTEAGHGACFGAFRDGWLAAQLGVFSDGSGAVRYQNVETHPQARGQGLAGTLVFQAGRYALAELAAERLVIVADPGYHAIRIYRSTGFADAETQLQLQREPGAG